MGHPLWNWGWRLMAGLLVATPALAQSQGVIDCAPSGHGANCQVPRQPNQTTATIHFRLSPPILGAPNPALQVKELPNGAVGTATLSTPGLFTYTWTGAAAGTDTTRLLVQTATSGDILTDTIHLLPAKGPMLAVHIPAYYPYVWLRDTWLPITIRAEIRPQGGSSQLTEDSCERIRFAFQPRAGGQAQPDTGFASWEQMDHDMPGRCIAETRWKLGDATGSQQLRVLVGDNDRVARTDRILTAYGREGPRIVAGIGYFTHHNSERSLYCTTPETPEADCALIRFGEDTLKREFPVSQENVGETFFGVEMPIFYPNQPGSGVATWISKRLRLLVGSTFDEPANNVFVGVSLIPLTVPAFERIPVQIQAGWRPSEGGYFIGGSVDGTALLTNALKALGAPL